MYLTFEVISPNGAALGAGRRKVFTVDGGRIGRSAENQMMLPGVGVHRHHATVRFINGVFFVEGVGTNGIAINDPDRVLPRNEPYPLKTGDRVFIDEYEVAVTASATAPAEPAAAPNAGAAASRGGARISDATDPGGAFDASPRARSSAPLVGTPGEAAEDLDPLHKLSGARTSPPKPQAPVDSSWNHSSSLQDHFVPPMPSSAPPAPLAAAAAGNVIPENWDRTSFDRSKLQSPPNASAPPHHPPRAAVPAPTSAGPPALAPRGSAPTPGVAPPGARAAATDAAGNTRAIPPSPAQRASSSASGAHVSGAASAPPSGGNAFFDWDGFLRATGVDPSRVPPETAAAMGNIMRSVVQGLIEVLRARSEIKTEFRMPVTQVKVSENNPLKFAANAEDALGNLLGRRNPAYLPPQEAFDDAFNDVRYHQLAMLAGVRAGFDNLMDRFDPVQLQEAFDRGGKRGGLFSGGGKSSYWERYAEKYSEMTADRDETFRRLFGEEFARAYEQQLSVLKRTRGGAT